jgi:CrcB protein
MEDHVRDVLLVGLGGFLGSVSRYAVSGVVLRQSAAGRFPLGTLVVNVLGCLVMGVLAGLAERWHLFGAPARLFLMTGLLGGFTTFSAFAYETYFLGREQAWLSAAANVLLSVALGLAALWVGHEMVRH